MIDSDLKKLISKYCKLFQFIGGKQTSKKVPAICHF